MCGRPSQARQRLVAQDMPVDDAPDDDDNQTRQTYNFAPNSNGLIYRAQTSDRGAGSQGDDNDEAQDGEPSRKRTKLSHDHDTIPPTHEVDGMATKEVRYELKAARWGLIPFWTKRAPDYSSQLRTINCRDDSLAQSGGMWNTMKQRKRCIVIAEGFYEWLKKNGGKDKVPHFVKRKDGQLMCFAGLWDCVTYEGSEDKTYTYTVITTDSNKQLSFLHDRMPVILEPGSDEMRAWLDPTHAGWTKELQSLLKPYKGELDCYPVDKAVGKVGNNSPSFVVPVDSKENKKNIANFFGKQRETAGDVAAKNQAKAEEEEVKQEGEAIIKQEQDEDRTTSKVEDPENNAPLPKPDNVSDQDLEQAMKRKTDDLDDDTMVKAANDAEVDQDIKLEISDLSDNTMLEAVKPSPVKRVATSPVKGTPPAKVRSATTNNTKAKTPSKDANAKITSFFGK
ncbi:hypothetical protein LTR15_001074 [Elasticomyces elasticus]|nr:hypothetical protein LTR15_001074 [Elasticomyces elasticus]